MTIPRSPDGARTDGSDAVASAAHRLGGAEQLEHARTLVRCNGAERQRELHEHGGPRAVVAWLADAFAP